MNRRGCCEQGGALCELGGGAAHRAVVLSTGRVCCVNREVVLYTGR